jgi:hypothetical protein
VEGESTPARSWCRRYQVFVPWQLGPHCLVEAFQELMLVPAPPTSFTPFTCRTTFAAVVEYPEWQAPHPALWWFEMEVWRPELGGNAWQEVQVMAPPVQTGAAVVVPPAKLPWQ